MPKSFLFSISLLIVFAGILYVIYRVATQEPQQLPAYQPGVTPKVLLTGKPVISEVPIPEPSSPSTSRTGEGCAIGGCSSQLCVDASMGDVASTCEWRDEYACYTSATCERQASGKCGWTMTSELQQCLENAQTRNDQHISF